VKNDPKTIAFFGFIIYGLIIGFTPIGEKFLDWLFDLGDRFQYPLIRWPLLVFILIVSYIPFIVAIYLASG
jgi:ABC-type amino acid transport system permease subunit